MVKPPAKRPRRAPKRPARRGAYAVRPAPKPRLERDSPVRAEIIAVGRELLRGRLADRNGPELARLLSERGARIARLSVVDDSERAVAEAVRESLERGVHLVVTAGGLGPSADDRTLAGIAAALERPLTLSPRARAHVEAAYRRLERQGLEVEAGLLNPGRQKMCQLPIGSEAIENPVGVAPGALLRLPGGAAVLALPGSPEECRAVFEQALPKLKELLAYTVVARREVETPSEDESAVQPVLGKLREEFPRVGVQSYPPDTRAGQRRVKVTLEARGRSVKEAELAVEAALRRLVELWS